MRSPPIRLVPIHNQRHSGRTIHAPMPPPRSSQGCQGCTSQQIFSHPPRLHKRQAPSKQSNRRQVIPSSSQITAHQPSAAPPRAATPAAPTVGIDGRKSAADGEQRGLAAAAAASTITQAAYLSAGLSADLGFSPVMYMPVSSCSAVNCLFSEAAALIQAMMMTTRIMPR